MQEPTPNSGSQVISEQPYRSEQSDPATVVQASEQIAATVTKPYTQNDPNQFTEHSSTSKAVSNSASEKPRFFSGVIFFVWIFSTLVFLSITAGYVAAH